MALYNLGLVSMLNGNRDNALDLFSEANTIAEDVFEIPFQAGRLCLENGNPDKIISQAPTNNPDAYCQVCQDYHRFKYKKFPGILSIITDELPASDCKYDR